MAKSRIEVVLCRTCVRDNPAEGAFADFESYAKSYQAPLKAGLFKKHADLKYQNCFAQCENFYCVQVTQGGKGFLLKQISSSEKIDTLLSWVKQSNSENPLTLPDTLQEHLIGPVAVQESYRKI